MPTVAPLPGKQLVGGQGIHSSGHIEVVLGEAFSRVGPPGEGHSSPFRYNLRMMVVLFRQCPYLVGKGQSLGEIPEPVGFLQLGDVVYYHDIPTGESLKFGLKIFHGREGVFSGQSSDFSFESRKAGKEAQRGNHKKHK